MKYTVAYQSKSGNTRKVAEQIYKSIHTDDKELINLDEEKCLPESDVYFIGFAIHDSNCSMDIIDCLEDLTDAKYALFATCGYLPTEDYKGKLQDNIEIWLPEDGDYLGMFLCQGAVEYSQQNNMIRKMPSREAQLQRMFEIGSSHPNSKDLQSAEEFAEMIQEIVEFE